MVSFSNLQVRSIPLPLFILAINNCLTKGGCLGLSVASPIGSQPSDDCSHALQNPGDTAMSPHVKGRKPGTRHTDKTVEREGGTGERKQPLRRVPTLETCFISFNFSRFSGWISYFQVRYMYHLIQFKPTTMYSLQI